ncbi:hypothetical protein [Auraticoccus monumenti]|uniref:Uncharacterized protein n=1 Tax=Auraticoccus monumenti TaxID=675864 RepID=A0A1G6UGP5_9ACTN|nr:hypothetical protein [Auraticoccus monumenti]SDD40441.1 hypothetical protein SAMN04489747_0880 [Auraticoccus monumenti]
MPHRALQITSPRHGVALGVYPLCAAIGLWHLTDLATATALIDLVTEHGASVWALALFLAGGFAFITASTAKPTNIRSHLVTEFWACIAIALTLGLYFASLIVGYPLASSLTTKSMVVAIVAGCVWRARQIHRELPRLDAALAQQRPASPVPLAAATPTD